MKFIKVFCCLFFLRVVDVGAAGELSEINAQIKQTEQQNKKLEQQVENSERNVEKTKKDLVKAADKVSELEDLRSEMERKIAELDAKSKNMVADMEKNKGQIADSAASVLFISSHPSFDSENMRDFVLTSALLTGVADRLDAEIEKANRQVNEIKKIRDARAVEKEKLDRSARKYAREKSDLDKLLKQRSAQNKKLKNQHSVLQKKLRDLSARAKTISELSAGVGSSEMSADAKFSRRKLNLPVKGKLVVRFGEKTALGLKSDGWRVRTRGEALVMAPADGVVKFADTFRGFGRVVIMSHKNGYNTVMTNLGEVNVALEQEVLAGEPIGRINPDKSEMYLEVRRGNSAVDPARLFKEN